VTLRPTAAVALALLVSGCGTGDAAEEKRAAPTGSWQLVAGIDPTPAHTITLVVEGDRVGGTAACNSYGGTAIVKGDAFAVRDLSHTEVGCEPQALAAEAAYLDALARVDAFRRDGDELLLTGPSVELRFEPTEPVPARELLGTRWTLDTLIQGDTASSVRGSPMLQFRGDGSLEGGTGCRAFRGRYVLADDEVRVLELDVDDAVTAGTCSSAGDEQERIVLGVLGDGFRAAVEGDRLTLTAAGPDALVYRAP
jgi:heat shock protein HslJ